MLESFVSDAFEYKKLTEAEQKSRGILGRLVGVIADTQKPTRNGRKYSEKLWENVFENPIMKEKITNRCCFGELNHPADRSEVDLERVAICLAEYPKKNSNGQLYGVFDILSTPNGRILKALCDYGCKIGISSRGQGDLITNDDGEEEVDPDTYDCECFDAVIVPGVMEARLECLHEGLTKNKTLSRTLTEALATATSDDRKIMEETLDMLKIKLTEAEEKEEEKEVSDVADDAAAETDIKDTAEVEGTAEEAEDIESDENIDDEESDEEPADFDDDIDPEDPTDLPEEDEERSDEEIFLNFLETNFDKDQIKKVCDILDIEVDVADAESDNEDDADEDDADIDSKSDDTITDEEAEEAESDDIIDNTNDEDQDEAEEEVDEAKNNGSEFLVNSLKEALTKTADLESTVKSLQESLAVRDAEVSDLTEECSRYKSSIARLSTLAKSTKELKESVSNLEKQVSEKDELIESQKARISRLAEARKADVARSNEVTTLTESLNTTKANCEAQINTLNEELSRVKAQATADQVSLNEKLAKANKLTEGYKNLANSAVNKYIEVKANMIGLTSKDIKRKLGESYTIADIDDVCESLKSYSLNVSKLPFSVDRKVSVRVNESVSKTPAIKNPSIFDEDEVSSTLLKLADFDD